ncbi:hypothetical protein DFQ27_008282 [Actinomortierella ambigua]|uniref:FAD dependent oxidoreductase domain-containing protein n=1 Tax=Actinomortierella ambigua TaxID=1343610 RepID=A0A9P6QIB7_9FUNG|nr:hypothetical protein DFQ27_008282 [Actinomortierella ambigua]
MTLKYNVTVLGAGVSGLSTSLALLEGYPGRYHVKIVATHLPSDTHIDYTSPWAGAHWRSYADIADLQQQAETTPDAGVMFLTGHDYWDVKPKDFQDPWFKAIVKNYRHIPKKELPVGVEFGIDYTTVALNAPKYLKYLEQRFLKAGGVLERMTVPSLQALARIPHSSDGATADIIINCSGLGSRNLFGVHDHQMFPTRGQIVIANVEEHLWPIAKQFTMERYAEGGSMGSGTITYVIPRDNGEIVLGGTMQHYNTRDTPCEETTRAIVDRVTRTRPDLFSTCKVLRSCVGLRPNRRGGVNVSARVERLDWNSAKLQQEHPERAVVLVAHNYGHGSYGYQSSIGCAQETVHLIDANLTELARLRDVVTKEGKVAARI